LLLQHIATLCNTLQHTATHCNTLQHIPTRCSTLQHTATLFNTRRSCSLRTAGDEDLMTCVAATHRNTLQQAVKMSGCIESLNVSGNNIANKGAAHVAAAIQNGYTATHCNTLQHTATHRNTRQHLDASCNNVANKGAA